MAPIDEVLRYVIGQRTAAERDRLRKQAEDLLAMGYEPDELMILSNVRGTPPAEVVPRRVAEE